MYWFFIQRNFHFPFTNTPDSLDKLSIYNYACNFISCLYRLICFLLKPKIILTSFIFSDLVFSLKKLEISVWWEVVGTNYNKYNYEVSNHIWYGLKNFQLQESIDSLVKLFLVSGAWRYDDETTVCKKNVEILNSVRNMFKPCCKYTKPDHSHILKQYYKVLKWSTPLNHDFWFFWLIRVVFGRY